jgi:hypothetical protein
MKYFIIIALAFAVTICNQEPDVELQYLTEEFEQSNDAFGQFLVFADKKDSKKKDSKKKDKDDDDKDKGNGEMVKNVLSGLEGPMNKALDFLKSGRSTTIVKEVIGEGFDRFVATAVVRVMKSIKAEAFETVLKTVERSIKVPEDRQQEVYDAIDMSQYVESNLWSIYDTLFSVDEGGQVKYVSLMIVRNDEDAQYHIILIDIAATFKLSPNILFINKRLSILGGIWSEEAMEERIIPKGLDLEQMQAIINFFSVAGYKKLADQFNIPFELPEF